MSSSVSLRLWLSNPRLWYHLCLNSSTGPFIVAVHIRLARVIAIPRQADVHRQRAAEFRLLGTVVENVAHANCVVSRATLFWAAAEGVFGYVEHHDGIRL